jgi:hypothetical protein
MLFLIVLRYQTLKLITCEHPQGLVSTRAVAGLHLGM